ncbi:MAG: MBL fold metallo-hydrolase [Phormidesmis sp. RL_2_1]|nr:MBL fold metallo-hydrolase [Phormidesmis sp. RL_2_1]
MKRRQLLKYASAAFVSTLGLGLAANYQTYQAQANKQSGSLTITALGHTAFLFTGGGQRILVNPFKAIGCTAGYAEPAVDANLVLLSSRLFDEGFLTERYANTQVIDEPGDYSVNGLAVQGVSMPHDRLNGRRFGSNVAWVWSQSGVKVVHLGGAAAPISVEDKILIGRPDVLLLPVGGGPKAYNPEEAVAAVRDLNPKIVIPTHYRTQAADAEACDIVGVDQFIALMSGTPVTQGDNTLSVSASSFPSSGMRIEVLSYAF